MFSIGSIIGSPSQNAHSYGIFCARLGKSFTEVYFSDQQLYAIWYSAWFCEKRLMETQP